MGRSGADLTFLRPFSTFRQNVSLRHQLYLKFNNRAFPENGDILLQVLQKRYVVGLKSALGEADGVKRGFRALGITHRHVRSMAGSCTQHGWVMHVAWLGHVRSMAGS